MELPNKSAKLEFFRDLPKSISHKILSLLDIKDVARVSTLSRTCRKLCLSLPFLTINLESVDAQGFYRFSSFLHRFMSLRNGVSIQQFEVELYSQRGVIDEQIHIGNWVLEANKCNAEKICLHLFKFRTFTFPSGVLNSARLRDLEVWLSPRGLLNLPTTSFGGLQNLILRDMRLTSMFCEWISGCKSLKTLHLHNVAGINELNITSSSLGDLMLEDMQIPSTRNFTINISAERLHNLQIVWLFEREPLQSLTLRAPYLKQFSWGGRVCRYSCEGNLDCLCYSDISIDFNKDEHGDLNEGIIGDVLRSMYRVSSFSIHDNSIKDISSQEMLPEFSNLHSLTIVRSDSSDKIPSTVSLLNLMPHLNTLKIEGYHFSKEEKKIYYSAEYWESQNLKFVHSLKEVEMQISGEHNEMELIKYLLKNAEALEKMTIRYYTSKSNLRYCEISEKIQQFQIASSSIVIYFFHRPE
ncbi:F-box/FBD/LRR-repeat protein At5g53840-like [Ziziphus jujuba]|uniref:F-box/FBD/LRR-repeat protein At5g53840-like n=1 Tax=Ziziphus jujuba TaxID=326968 RepID=A0A6P4A8G2_ZIZJJ|nr:F-box/FBD/LRR-repeat protein At5g53840-like [Ziziphus jujuba]XP_060670909.1 F-box/FBD/LRR-repeat protein At5g53840-like [Ziziphus jujuba]